MAEAQKEEVKTAPKAAVNPRNVNDKGENVGTKIPGRPVVAKKEAPVVGKRTEVLFQTPSGKLCKKIYETVRTKNASYRRCIQVLKNVKG